MAENKKKEYTERTRRRLKTANRKYRKNRKIMIMTENEESKKTTGTFLLSPTHIYP